MSHLVNVTFVAQGFKLQMALPKLGKLRIIGNSFLKEIQSNNKPVNLLVVLTDKISLKFFFQPFQSVQPCNMLRG